MDEYTADAFANRDEPVPLLTVSYSDVDISSSEFENESKRKRLRKSLSPSRLKEKAQGYQATRAEQSETNPDGRASLQDRLFAKLLQQVIPSEDINDEDDDASVNRRSSKYVSRPAFSLPLMTSHFRRFNARVGIIFVFQNRVIRLFSWRAPTHTISFLVTYTFVCLEPSLLLILPLAVVLLFIMVPAFLSRHPPPPSQSLAAVNTHYSTYTGPALAPARTIKPAAETSKDFFRNMRDIQNSMGDFTALHDSLVDTIAPATNFSDEILSSTVFLYLTILTTALCISAHLLPIRLILLIGGYIMTISGHPRAQVWLIKQKKRLEHRRALALSAPPGSKVTQFTTIPGIPFALPPLPPRVQPFLTTLSAITLSTAPETREVEIFELQHRPLSSSMHPSGAAAEWQPHLYTSAPYDPLSPSRIAGDRPRGTRFFEDVQPPDGWEWANKKWELDLEAGEWTAERLIVGVEYDAVRQKRREDEDGSDSSHEDDNDDGDEKYRRSVKRRESINGEFGGWVWDLPPAPGTGGRDEEVWLAYGDYDIPKSRKEEAEKEKGKKSKEKKTKDWEEAVRYGGRGRTGEWRRRRWVRLVKRRQILEYSR